MPSYDLKILKTWLLTTVKDLSDADPATLTEYIVALLHHSGTTAELKIKCFNRLEIFFNKGTQDFVNRLFDFIENCSIDKTIESKNFDHVTDSNDSKEYEQNNNADLDSESPLKKYKNEDFSPNNKKPRIPVEKPKSRSSRRSRSPQLRSVVNSSGNGARRNRYDKSRSPSPYSRRHRNNQKPSRSRPRCTDYDQKGVCLKGDQCEFDHGNDPLVVANFGQPTAYDISENTKPLIDTSSTSNCPNNNTTNQVTIYTPEKIPLIDEPDSCNNIAPTYQPSPISNTKQANMEQSEFKNKEDESSRFLEFFSNLRYNLIKSSLNQINSNKKSLSGSAPFFSMAVPPPGYDNSFGKSRRPFNMQQNNSICGNYTNNSGRQQFQGFNKKNIRFTGGRRGGKQSNHSGSGISLGSDLTRMQKNAHLAVVAVCLPESYRSMSDIINCFKEFGTISKIELNFESREDCACVFYSHDYEAERAHRHTGMLLGSLDVKVIPLKTWISSSSARGDLSGSVKKSSNENDEQEYDSQDSQDSDRMTSRRHQPTQIRTNRNNNNNTFNSVNSNKSESPTDAARKFLHKEMAWKQFKEESQRLDELKAVQRKTVLNSLLSLVEKLFNKLESEPTDSLLRPALRKSIIETNGFIEILENKSVSNISMEEVSVTFPRFISRVSKTYQLSVNLPNCKPKLKIATNNEIQSMDKSQTQTINNYAASRKLDSRPRTVYITSLELSDIEPFCELLTRSNIGIENRELCTKIENSSYSYDIVLAVQFKTRLDAENAVRGIKKFRNQPVFMTFQLPAGMQDPFNSEISSKEEESEPPICENSSKLDSPLLQNVRMVVELNSDEDDDTNHFDSS